MEMKIIVLVYILLYLNPVKLNIIILNFIIRNVFIAISVSTPVTDIPSKSLENNQTPTNGIKRNCSTKVLVNYLGNSTIRSIIPSLTTTESTQAYVIFEGMSNNNLIDFC